MWGSPQRASCDIIKSFRGLSGPLSKNPQALPSFLKLSDAMPRLKRAGLDGRRPIKRVIEK